MLRVMLGYSKYDPSTMLRVIVRFSNYEAQTRRELGRTTTTQRSPRVPIATAGPDDPFTPWSNFPVESIPLSCG